MTDAPTIEGGHRIEHWPLPVVVAAMDRRNAKAHDIPRLRESLERYGFTLPVLVDDATNLLLAGHGRTIALQQLHEDGHTAPDRITVLDGTWYVPVIRGVELGDDDEALAYLADDNELTIAGGWNAQGLADTLQHLAESSRLPVAMDQGYLDGLLADLAGPNGAQRGAVDPFNADATSDDYYTPASVFEALGLTFELDVCSPPVAPEWIPARRRYTIEDDGLAQPWEGLVWMNPPYSRPAPWVERFLEHRNGIALVQFTKSRWFSSLWNDPDTVMVVPPSATIQFVGGQTWMPVVFVALGAEAVEAVPRLGRPR